jgi:aminoglycoside 6-adenylyltransferase
MRGEQEVLELILNTAREDERIRAVVLSGSRANPHARRDFFRDFDVAYFVTDVASFTDDPAWIDRFGEIMILQTPEAMGDPPPVSDGRYSYLMQFTDGNRIDLTLTPVASAREFKRESLSLLLLDKDNVFEPFPAPDESDFLPKPPDAKAFSDCCNEFWWVCTYVAKGLWREEIIYAKYMFDRVVREQLMKMLAWNVGVKTRFTLGPGKVGKHLRRYLEPELWAMLEKTYSDAGYENTWDALFTAGDLFRTAAGGVARHFGFEYPRGDDERVSAHLKHVRFLPRDAEEMY